MIDIIKLCNKPLVPNQNIIYDVDFNIWFESAAGLRFVALRNITGVQWVATEQDNKKWIITGSAQFNNYTDTCLVIRNHLIKKGYYYNEKYHSTKFFQEITKSKRD